MKCPQCSREVSTVTAIRSNYSYFDILQVNGKEVIVREDDSSTTVIVTHDDESECQFNSHEYPKFLEKLFGGGEEACELATRSS
jgi:c-di-GMP-binding flagellar brake protein YcgR